MRQTLVLAWRSTVESANAGLARLAAYLAPMAEYLGLTRTLPASVGAAELGGEPGLAAAPSISRDARMLNGPVLQSLFALALPIMGANMLQVGNQFIDAFWVGRLGAVGVAAVAVANPIIIVLLFFGMGFSVAGTALVAQYAGARRRDMVDHVAGQTIIAVLSLSVVLSALGMLAAPGILDLMGVARDVRSGALAFLHIAFVGLPFAFATFMFQGLMRGIGRASIPLTITAGTVTLNFILNPIFIFGMGPIPAFGVAGSALSTFIAQLCGASVAAYILSQGRLGIAVRWRKLRPDLAQIKRTVILGYPAAIEGVARGASLLVMTFLVATFGTVANASYGVGNTFLSLVLIPAMGFSMATSILVGQNLGAKQAERAARVARAAMTISFIALSVFGLFCFVMAETLVRTFIPNDAAVVHEASLFLRIMAMSFGFMGLQYACVGVLRAAGMMMVTMMVSIIAQWMVQFPLAYILATHTTLAVHGVYWAILFAQFVSATIAFCLFLRGDWKRARLIEQARS